MIPSDHFIRFYNEVFKFLADQSDNAIEDYWLTISKHQELHVLDLFREKGFEGMKQYWDHIIEEENLEGRTAVFPDHFECELKHCKSLAKAMDNDAGLMPRYCDHCAAWIGPIMHKLGYYLVYDIISPVEPTCIFKVFRNKIDAEKALKQAILPAAWKIPQKK